jgi:hypothetical protein
LFFHIACISQLSEYFPHKAGVYRLLGSRYELARIVFVTFGQSQEKLFGTDIGAIHKNLSLSLESCRSFVLMNMARVCQVTGTLVTEIAGCQDKPDV